MKKNCNSKINHTCTGNLQYAPCVQYQLELPEFSELEGCITIEETTEELYNLVGEIKTETDLSALGESCLDYVLEEGKIIVKNVLLKYEEKICEYEQRIESLENRQLCDIPIGDCISDLDCLALPCDASIVTLADWMQAVQTKICETP